MRVSRKHQSRIWRSRLFGVFFFCFVAVFLVGLPVGRTPDYIGKQIEAGEAPTRPQWSRRRETRSVPEKIDRVLVEFGPIG
jgi:hypothetical protein